MSPLLLERYLNAAGKISALAIGDPTTVPGSQTFMVRQDRSQDSHIEGMPIGTFGGGQARVTLPLDGEYVINAKLFRTNLGAMRGLELPNQFEVSVDQERVLLVPLGGEKDYMAHLANPTVAADEIDSRLQARVKLKAGPHTIAVAWVQRSAEPPWKLQPFTRSSIDTIDMTGWPHIDRFGLSGPFNATGPGDTPSRRRGVRVQARPARPPRTPVRRRIVSTLGRRAFRGQMTDGDLGRLMEFYAKGKARPAASRAASSWPCSASSPARSSCCASNATRTTAPAGTPYRLSDYELASRLSFFLWSRIPDDELLDLAKQGRLKNKAVLDAAGAADAARSEGRALRHQFRGPVAVSPEPEEHDPELGGLPRLRRQPASGVPCVRRSCSPRASSARTGPRSTS